VTPCRRPLVLHLRPTVTMRLLFFDPAQDHCMPRVVAFYLSCLVRLYCYFGILRPDLNFVEFYGQISHGILCSLLNISFHRVLQCHQATYSLLKNAVGLPNMPLKKIKLRNMSTRNENRDRFMLQLSATSNPISSMSHIKRLH